MAKRKTRGSPTKPAKRVKWPAAVTEWLGHIKALAVDIGPRGPTREGERRGADHAEAAFRAAGLAPVRETFRSARSIFHPHLAGSLLMLAAFALFPVAGRVSAAVSAALGALVIVCELLELGMRWNPLRILIPHGQSQNVHAVIPPKGSHERDLVLVGHMDTQRTPLVFRTPRWVNVYDRFTTVAFAGFLWQAVVFALAAFFPLPWAWPVAIPGAACAALLAALCIQAESTPFTAGANDNASAVGIVLTLARHFARKPLERTRVLAVVTGCEEVQHYGMADFYRRHRAELKDPRAVVFELLGCAGPSWIVKEGIIVPFRPDPSLVAAVERLAAANPGWQAYPSSISGGNTELADAVRAGVPAIALLGKTREGVAPYWHQRQDTFDKMDPGVMARTWDLALALIRDIDRS
jgi:hypothetical protein